MQDKLALQIVPKNNLCSLASEDIKQQQQQQQTEKERLKEPSHGH